MAHAHRCAHDYAWRAVIHPSGHLYAIAYDCSQPTIDHQRRVHISNHDSSVLADRLWRFLQIRFKRISMLTRSVGTNSLRLTLMHTYCNLPIGGSSRVGLGGPLSGSPLLIPT